MTTVININDVTNLSKNGTFDLLVSELGKHLVAERTAGRITGQEYTTAYINLMTAALQQSLSFELQKYQVAAQTDLIKAQTGQVVFQNQQIQAETSRIGADITRINAQTDLLAQQKLTEVEQTKLVASQKLLADMQLEALEEEILKTKAEVLILDTQELLAEQQLLQGAKELLKADKALLQQDADLSKTNAEIAVANKQLLVMQSQIDGQTKQNLRTDEEILFTKAKTNVEKASYLDSVDGSTVTGVLGKQKLLLAAQTDGFARNAEQGLAKAVMEVFSVMRTTDTDGVDPSTYGLSPTVVGQIVAKAKSGIGA